MATSDSSWRIIEDNKLLIAILVIAILTTIALSQNGITGGVIEREPRHSFAFSAPGLSDGSGNTVDISGGGKFSAMGMTGYAYFHNVWIRASGHITFKTAEGEIKTNWKAEKGFYGFQEIDPWLNITAKITGQKPAWLNGTIEIKLNEGSEPTFGTVIVYAGPTTYSGAGTVVVELGYS